MAQFSSLDPTPSDPKRRSWRRKVVVAVLVLAVFMAAFYSWAYWRANKVIREAIAFVEQSDPQWRLKDIEANRRQLNDNENSALVVLAGKKLVDASLRDLALEKDSSDVLETLNTHPNARLNEEQKRMVAGLLKPYQPALVEWSKIADLPYGRFPIVYSPDFIGTLLPHVQDTRDMANSLKYQLLDRVAAGDVTGAVRSMKCLLHANRAIGDEPLLISLLVRIAIRSIAVNNLQWLLAQMQLDEPALAAIQSILEEDEKAPLLTNTLRGERAGSFELFEHMKKDRNYAANIGGFVGAPGSQWGLWNYVMAALPGGMAVHQADTLIHLTKAVAISKHPVDEQIDAFQKLDKETVNLSMLARLLAPAVSKVGMAQVRSQAILRCAIVGVAAERYRLKLGRFPNQLDDLVKERFLTAVPIDPYDGKPLRWKETPDGRLVYSVGRDRTDNAGYIDPNNANQDGSDLGFRLFNPDQRGTEPRPVRPKPPEEPG
jgi:hypothetical protein